MRFRRPPERIAAMVFILPRMEAPFIAEWARYLALHGVSKLFLVHDTGSHVWFKKPRLEYYCPQMDDAEFALYWEEQLKRVRDCLDLEVIAMENPDRKFIPARRIESKTLVPRIADEGFDWLLAHDVDEFLVPMEHATLAEYLRDQRAHNAILVKQLVFESRWDPDDGFRPRPAAEIKRYNPKPLPVAKFIARPACLAQVQVHTCVLESGTMLHEVPEQLVLHHYRGVETAQFDELIDIQDFPAVIEEPLFRT